MLAGEILRGQGEEIEAALWLCDLQDFTAMTARIGSKPMIQVMNAYFDCMAEAVWEQGGEVLKFMGDAISPCFESTLTARRRRPRSGSRRPTTPWRASRSLGASGGRRLPSAPRRLALHRHRGLQEHRRVRRLDFTVMGGAVNLVAPFNTTGSAHEPLLLRRDRGTPGAATESVGYEFKGVSRPVEVFKSVRET